jgi:YVTN family beta-propeller protein
MLCISAVLAATLAGCHVRQAVVRSARLDNEGEIFLYLQPLPSDAARLSFDIQSIAARSSDGAELPLEVLSPEVSGAGPSRQRLLAFGRLPRGSYAGFSIRVRRATLRAGNTVSDLVVPAEATFLGNQFMVGARDAVVLWATLRYPTPERDFEFTPSFAFTVPQQPVAQFTAFCTNTGTDDLVAIDEGRPRVVSALTTGRGPAGVALDPTATRAYVALSGEDQIEVFDLRAMEARDRIRLRPGDAPRELAVLPDGSLLVVNEASNSVSFVDPFSLSETRRVMVGDQPWYVLLDRSNRRGYVLNRRSNTITVIDLVARAVVGSVGTEPEPIRAALSRDGSRLYVIHGGSAYMTVLAVPTLTQLNRVFVGLGASAVRVDSRTDLVYVALEGANRVPVFDPFSLIPVKYLDVGGTVSRMLIQDNQNAMYLLLPDRRAVAVVDLTRGATLAVLDVGADPFALALAGERP